jgi:hypothetical protein
MLCKLNRIPLWLLGLPVDFLLGSFSAAFAEDRRRNCGIYYCYWWLQHTQHRVLACATSKEAQSYWLPMVSPALDPFRCTLAWQGYWLLSIPSRICENPRDLGTRSWVNGSNGRNVSKTAQEMQFEPRKAKLVPSNIFQHLLCGSRLLAYKFWVPSSEAHLWRTVFAKVQVCQPSVWNAGDYASWWLDLRQIRHCWSMLIWKEFPGFTSNSIPLI